MLAIDASDRRTVCSQHIRLFSSATSCSWQYDLKVLSPDREFSTFKWNKNCCESLTAKSSVFLPGAGR
jgi:hypothetical protein